MSFSRPCLLLLAIAAAPILPAQADVAMDPAAAGRFAQLALACVHLEYPNKISHTLQGDADVRPPRELTPVFFGCYDWHSAVHGHWLLARLARLKPDAAVAVKARDALAASLRRSRTSLRHRSGQDAATARGACADPRTCGCA